MIKSKYVLALAAVCLLVVSCKSSPKKNKGGNAEAEQTEVVQEEAGTENTEDSKKSKKEKKSKIKIIFIYALKQTLSISIFN